VGIAVLTKNFTLTFRPDLIHLRQAMCQGLSLAFVSSILLPDRFILGVLSFNLGSWARVSQSKMLQLFCCRNDPIDHVQVRARRLCHRACKRAGQVISMLGACGRQAPRLSSKLGACG